MSNGSMQFLGRQLAEQAKALQTLVEKMTQMVQNQDESIPKFSIASDNLQIAKNYGETRVSTTSMIESFYSYLGGNIRIVVEAKNYSASANMEILINGALFGKSVIATGTNYSLLVIDIPVKEEDLVECRFVSNGTAGDIYKRKFEIRYDLVAKPNIAITM